MDGGIGLELALWSAGAVSTVPAAVLAAALSLLAALLMGPVIIPWLAGRTRTPIRNDSRHLASLQSGKISTPSMGGLFLIAAMLLGLVAFGDWRSTSLWIIVLAVLAFAALGAADDSSKLASGGRGLSFRIKLACQTAISLLVGTAAYLDLRGTPDALCIALPGISTSVPLGLWLIPLATLVLVASCNAVNLTDGLDGLAGGCLVFAAVALGAVATAQWSGSAQDTQMLIALGALVGAVLGFLWFNCFPARVFMGDTGSLPLGALLGLTAVYLRQELMLVILAGVFVAEAASVLAQVTWYRLRRRRIFRCAPLHHHFQFKGWSEDKIVARFWLASAFCGSLAVGLAGWQISGERSGPTKGLPHDLAAAQRGGPSQREIRVATQHQTINARGR